MIERMTLKASQLTIDPNVQRDVEADQVKSLVSNWRERSVGTIVVSKRVVNGKSVYVVLDGYQRKTAVEMMGRPHYKFNADVHEGLTLREEAQLFLDLNRGRKNVSPYHVHRVALTMGDPVAVAVEKAVTDLGLKVGPASSAKTVGCVSTLNRIVGKAGTDIDDQATILSNALLVFAGAWPLTDDCWRSEIVEGLATVLSTYGDQIDLKELEHKLSRLTVSQLLATAKARSTGSNRVLTQVVEVIVEKYNGRKTTKRLALARAV